MTKGSELSPGTFVDRRYQVKRILGRGGFGRTYLAADDRRFGELCVLKEFVPRHQGDSVIAQKLHELFHREAQILHQLNHPQIPKFFAVFEENHRLFIAQEYIDGKTYWRLLQERQKRGRAFSQLEVFQWLCHLLPVLSYLHHQNIVHRDISPDNIMLPRDGGLPVLIDFGVVKQAAPHWYEISSINPDGSVEASVSVGKLGYAPYEQIRIGQCSPRSDLYALAVTAAVLLTAKSPNHLIDPKSLEWKWRSLVRVQPEFAQILETMMAERPQDRYASADQVLNDLVAIQDLMHATAATTTVIRSAGLDQAPVSPHAVTAIFSQGNKSAPLSLDSTLLEATNRSTRSLEQSVAGLAAGLAAGQLAAAGQGVARGSAAGQLAVPSSKSRSATTDSKRMSSRGRAFHSGTASNDDFPARVRSNAISRSPGGAGTKANRPSSPEPAVPLADLSTLYPITAPQQSTSITRLTVLVDKSPKQRRTKQLALLSLLGVLSMSGLAVGVQSPHIAMLCRSLNNCADGQWVEREYQQATHQAETAKSLSDNASQIDDLQQARDRIRQAISKLRILPSSSDYADPVQQVLPNYDDLLAQIESRLEKEERSAKLLSRAEVEARMATEHTQAARTRQDYENARSLWRKALATIGAISSTSFVAEEAATRSQDYTAQLNQVEQQIAAAPPVASPSPTDTPSLRITRRSSGSSSPADVVVSSSVSQGSASPAPQSTAPTPQSSSTAKPPQSTPSASGAASQPTSRTSRSIPSISLAPGGDAPAPTSPSPVTAAPLPAPQPAPASPSPSNRLALSRTSSPVPPGNVPLSVTQTLNEVSVRLSGARVNPRGTFVATILVENDSERTFGFVPLFAEVRDADGQTVSSRVTFNGSPDAMIAPGGRLQGEVYLLDRVWKETGSQDLTLVIREGTTGSRRFYVSF
ncbi:protein kinase domain-containing protein [Egbenema bharatensis]|uniref:protein kinase domain-containing protein n=1 Tax=Egbenema bharatensis TaxID=3463334 RepID=UPI003A8922D3